MSYERSNAEILDELFDEIKSACERRQSKQGIRFDKERDAILIPYPNGCGVYEIDRGSFKTGFGVCELAIMLREKKGVSDADILDVLEEAFAAPGFLV